jgi:hypothetical protein
MSRALTLAATLVACVLIATAFRAAEIQLESVEAAGADRPALPAAPRLANPVGQAVASTIPVSRPAKPRPFVRDVAARGIDRDIPAPRV